MQTQTITWQNFYKSFLIIKANTPSYRLGQHFMNMFIQERGDVFCTEELKGLWEKTGDEAVTQCWEIIGKYQWDVQALPLVQGD